MPEVRPEWRNAHLIVVKIGSALLADSATGRLNEAWLGSLMDDIAALKAEGKQIVLVSSGAIALGRHALRLPSGPLKLEESQAAAAVGQVDLAHAYRQMLSDRGLAAAQILLTLGDTEQRRRYLNARSTMRTLLSLGAVPVVNENDTVATTEIRYGDNDRLAARVASMISADCLVLLSDVDGLYTSPPDRDPGAQRLEVVQHITPEIEAMAGDAGTELSRGGMVTKIEAGKIAVAAGTNMIVALGKRQHPLAALSEGASCTWFLAHSTPLAARKRWIAGRLDAAGALVIDDGAVAALKSGRSLLPAGVVDIEGVFERGDTVIIRDRRGNVIGRGLAAYSSSDARLLVGRKTREIEQILGYRGRDEMIHRDDMALTPSAREDENAESLLSPKAGEA
ncbi:glutamate 5-kinase [Dichotomicrobium thermohalophilum]|uniref:Glutamate 5-kinase n=1 Tax=Dichotomicrobium thermohalophilum TaxID=933063 RepID=A0A397PNF3_9HYPH|nr:glutamate 5-kinase [Dichotomicrobium thermohalophilum]RIA47271.1 glutamate 5-kinase [Dichotomicrobium thermohalophilum]